MPTPSTQMFPRSLPLKKTRTRSAEALTVTSGPYPSSSASSIPSINLARRDFSCFFIMPENLRSCFNCTHKQTLVRVGKSSTVVKVNLALIPRVLRPTICTKRLKSLFFHLLIDILRAPYSVVSIHFRETPGYSTQRYLGKEGFCTSNLLCLVLNTRTRWLSLSKD